MNKKIGHIIFILFDLLCFEGLWSGYHEFQRILLQTINQVDLIRFSNRAGFFVFGVGFPLIHFFIVVENFRPALIHKYRRLMNVGAMALIMALFVVGFACSSWIESQVKKAGYVYCREASGISALAKSLVYTRNRDICADLATGEKGS